MFEVMRKVHMADEKIKKLLATVENLTTLLYLSKYPNPVKHFKISESRLEIMAFELIYYIRITNMFISEYVAMGHYNKSIDEHISHINEKMALINLNADTCDFPKFPLLLVHR